MYIIIKFSTYRKNFFTYLSAVSFLAPVMSCFIFIIPLSLSSIVNFFTEVISVLKLEENLATLDKKLNLFAKLKKFKLNIVEVVKINS